MEKEERIVSYTVKEIEEMIACGQDRTDWEKVRALTDEEIEASIDFEEEGEFDLSTARASSGFPWLARDRNAVLDPDVIAWFQKRGPDYESRINAVLRAYIGEQSAEYQERKAS
jgi:uncharacterized protein (DUF4415 family)